MLYFVKVRINLDKLPELGEKLANGTLKTDFIKYTFCIKDDPSVGVNIWEVKNEADFEEKFAPHKAFYQEVIEITPVITSEESQQLLMAQM